MHRGNQDLSMDAQGMEGIDKYGADLATARRMLRTWQKWFKYNWRLRSGSPGQVHSAGFK